MSRPVILPSGDAVAASSIKDVIAIEEPSVLVITETGYGLETADGEDVLELRAALIEEWKEGLE